MGHIDDKTRGRMKIYTASRGPVRRHVMVNDDATDSANFQSQPKNLRNNLTELANKKKKREEVLSSILKALTNNLEQNFVEKNFVTLVYHCLHCLKKGSAKEMELAAKIIGLLAMILSYVDNVHEVYEDVITAFSQIFKSELNTLEILDCLGVVTFFGASNSDETERAMQLIWNFIHPNSHSNIERTHSPAVLTAAISTWSFLLTTVDGWRLSYKHWQGAILYFSNLLVNNDEALCAAAGEALALIFETNCLEKFSTEATRKELKDNIIEQLRRQSAKTSSEDMRVQNSRKGFNAILAALKFLEEGICLNTCVAVGDQELKLSTWSQIIQLKFMKLFLGNDGFAKHMMQNKNVRNVFDFMPKKRNSSSTTLYEPEREEITVRFLRPPSVIRDDGSLLPFISREQRQLQKKMTMSPNSYLSKARTKLMNKHRLLSEGRANDCFAVADEI